MVVYLLAVLGAFAIGYLLWRTYGAEQVRVGTKPRRSMAPDDDPDFLRKLGEQTKRRNTDGPDSP